MIIKGAFEGTDRATSLVPDTCWQVVEQSGPQYGRTVEPNCLIPLRSCSLHRGDDTAATPPNAVGTIEAKVGDQPL